MRNKLDVGAGSMSELLSLSGAATEVLPASSPGVIPDAPPSPVGLPEMIGTRVPQAIKNTVVVSDIALNIEVIRWRSFRPRRGTLAPPRRTTTVTDQISKKSDPSGSG